VDNVHAFDWNQESFPKVLQKVGYQTALVGKIHLEGNPQGFDYSAVLPDQGDYYNPDFIVNGKKEQIHGYVTTITTELALNWLKKRDANKPFCLLYHQKAPHREWLPEPKYFREYVHKQFAEPASLFDDYHGRGTAARAAEMRISRDQNWSGDSKIYPEVMDRLGLKDPLEWGRNAFNNNLGRMDGQQRAAWDSVYRPVIAAFEQNYPQMTERELVHWRYERYMQDYLACIASVDDGVGEILDYLDKNGLAENTIVIYTSDQGFYLGEHGWFDKRFMYEESFRTPLLMRYPKEIKAGTRIDKLVQNLDFAPTFLDYAGVEIPKEMQGESFRRLVCGKTSEWRDAVYYTYYEYPSIHMVKRHYGIATEQYKLIHFYYDIDEWELYDLKKDPHEMHNVYNDPAYTDVQKDMHQRLDELRAKYGDSDEFDRKYIEQNQQHSK
jgi:arylsulfatase A-like enzyme